MKNNPVCVLALLSISVLPFLMGAGAPTAPGMPMMKMEAEPLTWHNDYFEAYRQARDEQKQLFIFFRDSKEKNAADVFEKEVLASPALRPLLEKVVRAILPLDMTIPDAQVAGDDTIQPEHRLLDHESFQHLQGRQGIVVIDLVDSADDFYGQVVSAHPFHAGRYYTTSAAKIVLGLPRATLTQRTLVYAVRIHPEAPRSTQGNGNTYLFKQAAHHSKLMAQYQSVGHHNWGYRYQAIAAKIGRGPSEVAASSWQGGTLVDAAKQCVSSWRGSYAHWGMVYSSQGQYGYDMARGPNGQWYATGIFAPQ